MKHGPIALIDDRMPLVALALDNSLYDKIASNIQEAKARGARIIALITEGDDRALPGKIRRRLALWHARPDFLTYDVRDLPSRFAASQRRRGLPIVTWTIMCAEHRQRAEDYADADIFESNAAPKRGVGRQA